ncbi:hypothetical protein D3C74_253960 [compost metagenome]
MSVNILDITFFYLELSLDQITQIHYYRFFHLEAVSNSIIVHFSSRMPEIDVRIKQNFICQQGSLNRICKEY